MSNFIAIFAEVAIVIALGLTFLGAYLLSFPIKAFRRRIDATLARQFYVEDLAKEKKLFHELRVRLVNEAGLSMLTEEEFKDIKSYNRYSKFYKALTEKRERGEISATEESTIGIRIMNASVEDSRLLSVLAPRENADGCFNYCDKLRDYTLRGWVKKIKKMEKDGCGFLNAPHLPLWEREYGWRKYIVERDGQSLLTHLETDRRMALLIMQHSRIDETTYEKERRAIAALAPKGVFFDIFRDEAGLIDSLYHNKT